MGNPIFKDFFSHLAESFLGKLLGPSNKYKLESVFLYYSNFLFPWCFTLKVLQNEKFLKH